MDTEPSDPIPDKKFIYNRHQKKITTTQQFEAMVAFMEKHTLMVHGRPNHPQLERNWMLLTDELNALGPPTRETSEWKKVWSDLKNKIRKDMEKNRRLRHTQKRVRDLVGIRVGFKDAISHQLASRVKFEKSNSIINQDASSADDENTNSEPKKPTAQRFRLPIYPLVAVDDLIAFNRKLLNRNFAQFAIQQLHCFRSDDGIQDGTHKVRRLLQHIAINAVYESMPTNGLQPIELCLVKSLPGLVILVQGVLPHCTADDMDEAFKWILNISNENGSISDGQENWEDVGELITFDPHGHDTEHGSVIAPSFPTATKPTSPSTSEHVQCFICGHAAPSLHDLRMHMQAKHKHIPASNDKLDLPVTRTEWRDLQQTNRQLALTCTQQQRRLDQIAGDFRKMEKECAELKRKNEEISRQNEEILRQISNRPV